MFALPLLAFLSFVGRHPTPKSLIGIAFPSSSIAATLTGSGILRLRKGFVEKESRALRVQIKDGETPLCWPATCINIAVYIKMLSYRTDAQHHSVIPHCLYIDEHL